MTTFKRCFSALLLCAFLFVQFSASSYAASSDKTIFDRLQDLREESSESSLAPIVEGLPVEDSPILFALKPDDVSDGIVHVDFSGYQGGSLISKLGVNTSSTAFSVKAAGSNDTSPSTQFEYVIDFSLNNGSPIGLKNEAFMLNLSNVWFALGTFVSVPSGTVYAELENYSPSFEVYADGTLLDGCSLTIIDSGTNGLVDLSLSIESPLPVNAFKISLKISGSRSDLFPSYSPTATRGLMFGIKSGLFSYQLLDSSSGFLASIIEWLRSIRDGISGVVSAIISLPARIWDFIESGLIALFIPDQQQIIDFNNAMDALLSDRLGALYQGTDIVIDFLMGLGTYEQQGSIRFPGMDLSAFGIPFVMEAQEVQIVPYGFDFLVDSIKFIVNVLSTILFLNSLKRRLERVFEGG